MITLKKKSNKWLSSSPHVVDYLVISPDTREAMGFTRTIYCLKGHFIRSEVTTAHTPYVNAYEQMVIYNRLVHWKWKT